MGGDFGERFPEKGSARRRGGRSRGRSRDRSRGRFVAAVVGAALIWSTSFVATKAVLDEVGPLTLGAVRFALAAAVLGVLVGAGGYGRPRAADLGWLAFGGVLGTTVYFSLENVGVDLATASDAALLVASYPAVTMALEALFYRARVSWARFAGVGLAVVGVYLIVGGSPPVAGGGRLLGDLVLLGAGVVWAFYNFATREVGGRYPNLAVVFYQTAAGALAFVPVAFIFEGGAWRIPSAGALLISAYLGIFCSVLAFLLYAYGLKGLDPGSAVNLLNLVPVFGVGFAVLLLGEPVGAAQLLGGLVVISGVALGLGPKSAAEESQSGKVRKAKEVTRGRESR